MCTQTANLRIKTHTRTTAAPAKRVPFLVVCPSTSRFCPKVPSPERVQTLGFPSQFWIYNRNLRVGQATIRWLRCFPDHLTSIFGPMACVQSFWEAMVGHRKSRSLPSYRMANLGRSPQWFQWKKSIQTRKEYSSVSIIVLSHHYLKKKMCSHKLFRSN